MAIDRGGLRRDQLDIDELLDELEKRIDRLKTLYEQYFMGIQKVEPRMPRADVQKRIQHLAKQKLRNTGHRYRFNMLNQRFNTYSAYWGRTLRAIENGTYYRTVARAGREAARRGEELPAELAQKLPKKLREKLSQEAQARARSAGRAAALRPEEAASGAESPSRPGVHQVGAADVSMDMSFDEAFDKLFDELTDTEKPAPAPAPKPPAPRPAPARPVPAAKRARGTLPPGMDEGSAQALYKRYVQAKKLLGEDTSRLKYEHIVATINKQAPQIMQRTGARAVEFSVVLKDDRVILKAKPKK